MVKTIFLDRDGVINVPTIVDSKPYAPRKFDKFTFYEGIENLLNYFRAKDYLLIVITNQPDIGNELVKLEEVERMHHLLYESLPVTEVIVCPHSQLDDCDCRKPKPGMIKTAIAKYNIDVNQSWLIGDRWSDILAGKLTGLQTIFIDRHYSENLEQDIRPDHQIEELKQIYEIIS